MGVLLGLWMRCEGDVGRGPVEVGSVLFVYLFDLVCTSIASLHCISFQSRLGLVSTYVFTTTYGAELTTLTST